MKGFIVGVTITLFAWLSVYSLNAVQPQAELGEFIDKQTKNYDTNERAVALIKELYDHE